MPYVGQPLGDGQRDRGAAQAGDRHQREVLVAEVGVVEQAGDEEGGAAAHADVLLAHDAQHLAGVPHVDEVDRLVP